MDTNEASEEASNTSTYSRGSDLGLLVRLHEHPAVRSNDDVFHAVEAFVGEDQISKFCPFRKGLSVSLVQFFNDLNWAEPTEVGPRAVLAVSELHIRKVDPGAIAVGKASLVKASS